MTWGPNAAETLAAFPSSALATGAGFAELVTADSPSSRYLAIQESSAQDGGDGVPYRAVYRLATPGGGARVVEDLGRWSADASGRPARAHGLMRLVAEDETPRVG
ncbi:MAG: GGDEF-domain containing protein, partial [Roseiarcus sp.]